MLISKLPSGAGDDFQYGTDDEELADLEREDGGPSATGDLPDWLFETHQSTREPDVEVMMQYKRAMEAPITDANFKEHILNNFIGTLKLQKSLIIQQMTDTEDIKEGIREAKEKVQAQITELMPTYIMTQLKNRLRKDDEMPRKIEALTTRVATIESTLGQILANQAAQTALLQQLLNAPASIQTLDDNKKGEKEVGATQKEVESSKAVEATTEGGMLSTCQLVRGSSKKTPLQTD